MNTKLSITRIESEKHRRRPRYLFEISVPDGDDERLTRIKERLRNVKDVMCIDGKMSKTQITPM